MAPCLSQTLVIPGVSITEYCAASLERQMIQILPVEFIKVDIRYEKPKSDFSRPTVSGRPQIGLTSLRALKHLQLGIVLVGKPGRSKLPEIGGRRDHCFTSRPSVIVLVNGQDAGRHCGLHSLDSASPKSRLIRSDRFRALPDWHPKTSVTNATLITIFVRIGILPLAL